MKSYLWQYRKLIIGLIYIVILFWSLQYFTTPVIKFDNNKFIIKQVTDQKLILESKRDNKKITVDIDDKVRTVYYNEKAYRIERDGSRAIYNMLLRNPIVYDVTYPTGEKYQVQSTGAPKAMFFTFDMNENVYSEDDFQFLDEKISPRALVKVSDISYFDKQGHWLKFMFALALISIGLLLLFNRFTQEMLFFWQFSKDYYEQMEGHRFFKVIILEGIVLMILGFLYMMLAL